MVLAFSRSNSNRITESNVDSRGVIYRTLTRPPTESPYNDDGSLRPNNPINTLLNSYQHTGSNRLIGNVFGELNITDNLSFKSSFALDLLSFKEDRFYPSTIFSFGGAQRTGQSAVTQQLNWVNENTLTFMPKLGEKHNLTALAGLSQQKNTTEIIGGSGSQYSTDLIPTLNAAAQRDALYTYETAYGILSYFARVNYTFDGKYMIGATTRYDGSSRFGANNRFGFFPSASIGWRVKEENFLKDVRFIDDLKIRGSIGKTGNQQNW
ncbi:MAG: TonB-dependent receptor [Bacteroidetes bacterium]|nr:TonB-dependent receptor [Bacteroidota bacterium]